MRNLFIRAVRGLEPTWHDRYKDICDKVSAVHDWRDSNDASDDLVKRVIYDTSNGVSSVGQAFTTWPAPRPEVGAYRDMLAHLKDGLASRWPSDAVANCREEFRTITRRKGAPSIFNRIVSAFQPGRVTPVMFENDFDDACKKLAQGGYIEQGNFRLKPGDDPWYSKNVWLMDQLRTLLPDGPCEGALMNIDDYSRGMFVWGVHEHINMDDWMIIRNRLGNDVV